MTTDLTKKAIAAHQKGKLKDAVRLYKKILAVDPNNTAIQHFAGAAYMGLEDFAKAAPLLQAASKACPLRTDYLFAYGNALYALERFDETAEIFARATLLEPSNPFLWLNLGNAKRALGQSADAISSFKQALYLDKNLSQALGNLVAVLIQEKDFEQLADLIVSGFKEAAWKDQFSELATTAITKSIELDPENSAVEKALLKLHDENPEHSKLSWVLGHGYFLKKDFEKAIQFYRQVVLLEPENMEARRTLSILLFDAEEADEGKAHLLYGLEDDPKGEKILNLARIFRTMIEDPSRIERIVLQIEDHYPDVSDFPHFLSDSFYYAHRYKQAEQAIKRAIEKDDKNTELYVKRGTVLVIVHNPIEAQHMYRKAIEIDPKCYAAISNLGGLLLDQGRLPEAGDLIERCLELKPDDIPALCNAAMIYVRTHAISEAIKLLEKAIKTHPESADLRGLLGNAKIKKGELEEGVKLLAEARELGKDDINVFKMQLMTLNYSHSIDPAVLADIHFRLGDMLVKKETKDEEYQPPSFSLENKPRLKIGYVSGDFRNHSCSHFIAPLLANHKATNVEVYCYSTMMGSDDMTLKLKNMVPHWRDATGISAADMAALIQKDGIDILVDLAGHTSGHRLDVFARKPAPIQVNWLGYPNTTGLPTIDYRFTDALADPPGMTEAYFREKLYRLPHFLCYEPPESTPQVSALPAAKIGIITFGCFNNSSKITSEVVDVWSKILHALPQSRLLLKTGNFNDDKSMEYAIEQFTSRGIEASRLSCLAGFAAKYDHLATYGEVDMALDPFPYNGTTTTCEALWMGIPMIALEGRTHASRVGACLMTTVGLPELVAKTTDKYADLAITLAQDIDRLSAYRSTLREQMKASPLMDAKGFAASVEDAYQAMWHYAVENAEKIDNSLKI